MSKFTQFTQGPATIVPQGSPEYNKDIEGVTNPNLHRRIDNSKDWLTTGQETDPRQYKLSVQGVNSYRNTEITTHDEDSTYVETP